MQGLRLEPLDERWVGELTELIDDPEVMRFTRIPDPPPEGFATTWIARYAAGREEGTREGFAVVGSDGRFLGVGLAPHIDREASEVELGYIVARGARGQGVAGEILRALTTWAFHQADAQRVILIIDVENPASEHVARRCGYQREGVMRSAHLKAGRRVNSGLWSRLPTDT